MVVCFVGVLNFVTSREERRLRVFENRALRKIFRTKRDDVTGEWRRRRKGIFKICTPQQVLFG
jgi:hypothetical protein